MNKKNLINSAKNSVIGKMLRRLAGEESGAIMMEYVIVAVLIAAAVAVGAWYFGRSVNNEFTVASHAVAAKTDDAEGLQQANQNAQREMQRVSVESQKAYIDKEEKDAADIAP